MCKCLKRAGGPEFLNAEFLTTTTVIQIWLKISLKATFCVRCLCSSLVTSSQSACRWDRKNLSVYFLRLSPLFPKPSPPHFFKRFRVGKCHSSLSPNHMKQAAGPPHANTHSLLVLLTLSQVHRMPTNNGLALPLFCPNTHRNPQWSL